jgi:hypothetical protein
MKVCGAGGGGGGGEAAGFGSSQAPNRNAAAIVINSFLNMIPSPRADLPSTTSW